MCPNNPMLPSPNQMLQSKAHFTHSPCHLVGAYRTSSLSKFDVDRQPVSGFYSTSAEPTFNSADYTDHIHTDYSQVPEAEKSPSPT